MIPFKLWIGSQNLINFIFRLNQTFERIFHHSYLFLWFFQISCGVIIFQKLIKSIKLGLLFRSFGFWLNIIYQGNGSHRSYIHPRGYGRKGSLLTWLQWWNPIQGMVEILINIQLRRLWLVHQRIKITVRSYILRISLPTFSHSFWSERVYLLISGLSRLFVQKDWVIQMDLAEKVVFLNLLF